MSKPIRIIIFGASGRMGQALLRLGAEDKRLHMVAAVTGRSIKPIAIDCPTYSISQLDQLPQCEVLIDFSQPEAFGHVVEYCQSHAIALVSGTTGIDDAQRKKMQALASFAPVLWASNFSLGVAVLNDLVERAAKALSAWNSEIIETHHIHKKDAPSGTALTLGQAVEAGSGRAPSYVSHREGEVIGDHIVQFSGVGEFIQLRHNALDRDIFARGALEAALRLSSKKPGMYSFSTIVFEND
jgi:4-hydroxy-tetrahydrodipicolinate reductase